MLVWTLSIGRQKFIFLYTCSLLLRNMEMGKEKAAPEGVPSCPMLTCCSRQPCWHECGIKVAQQSVLLTFQPQTVKEGMTLQKTVQIKNLTEIISERHSQHTVSCPWDVRQLYYIFQIRAHKNRWTWEIRWRMKFVTSSKSYWITETTTKKSLYFYMYVYSFIHNVSLGTE